MILVIEHDLAFQPPFETPISKSLGYIWKLEFGSPFLGELFHSQFYGQRTYSAQEYQTCKDTTPSPGNFLCPDKFTLAQGRIRSAVDQHAPKNSYFNRVSVITNISLKVLKQDDQLETTSIGYQYKVTSLCLLVCLFLHQFKDDLQFRLQ